MKILLDTCTFLWIIVDDEKLSKKSREVFLNENNDIYLSVISIWEIIVKYNLGRLPLPDVPELFIMEQCKLHQIEILEFGSMDVLNLSSLPNIHADPFDRMIICQALSKDMLLLTPDKHIHKYKIQTVW